MNQAMTTNMAMANGLRDLLSEFVDTVDWPFGLDY
jgi:hypothetical protein